MKLQRINDERLIIKNLQNIRLVYVIQTLGILGLLGYDVISNGLSQNPLWLVLIASTVVLAFMSFSSDERLAFNNLQKTRIAYAIQLLGIVGILGYELVTYDVNVMWGSPLPFMVRIYHFNAYIGISFDEH